MGEEPSVEHPRRMPAGDETAAAALFRRFVHRLIGLARSRIPGRLAGRVDPEDVVQSAYRSFFAASAAGHYQAARGDDLWELLATITLHEIHRQVVRFQAQKRAWDREVRFGSEDSLLGLHPSARDGHASPGEAAALLDEVEYLLRRLVPEQRPILELRLQGHHLEEIAAQTGRSVRTVRRVLDQVKTMLEQRDAPGTTS